MDPLRPLVLGTAAWAVALLVVLLGDGPGPQWWTWTAVIGLAMGLLGCVVARRRSRAQASGGASAPAVTD